MGDVAIRAEGLSKRYRIGRREPYYTLRDAITRSLALPFRRFRDGRQPNADNRLSPTVSHSSFGVRNSSFIWALKDVSFEIKRGEVVGIVGRNGAGKSTLLKILSSITEPTEGQVAIHGRVGSLLEVGTGFHPELTGRENVCLNGAIMGMKKAEIDQKFDQIVAFAEVEKFIDTPVKHYSSGMFMRLAFAVAAHLQPEVLLVDEVLAVGDAAFQKKCLGKMGDVAQEGRTVLLVSHNMAAIKTLCRSALLLESGCLAKIGPATSIIQNYIETDVSFRNEVLLTDDRLHRGGNDFRIERAAMMDIHGTPCARIPFGHPFQVVLEANLFRDVSGLHVGLGIAAPDGTRLTTTHHSDTVHKTEFRKGKIHLRCIFEHNFYTPGMYYLHVGAHSEDSLLSDYVPEALAFEILPVSPHADNDFQSRNFGLFRHPSQWVIEDPDHHKRN